MSLRITQSMLFNQSVRDLRHSLIGRTELQRQIASGVRVGRPSDDPAASLRIMPLNAEIRGMAQMIDNANLARETIDLGASTLEDASNLMQRARELTIQAANGTLNESDRKSIAEEIDQLLHQMVGLGNQKRGDRYLFGGTVDDRAPFRIEDGPGGTGVFYDGNRHSLSIEVGPGVDTELNLPGSEIFQNHRRGPTRFESAAGAATGAAPGPGFDTGVGMDRLDVTFAGLAVPGAVTGIAQGAGTTTALGPMSYTFTAPDQLSINGGAPVTVTNGDNTIPVGANGAVLSLAITLPITPLSGTFVSEANLSIDGGATATRVDFSGSNVLVRDPFDGTALDVDVSALTRTGQETVTYEGTFDAFSALVTIRDVLRGDFGADLQAQSTRLTGLLGAVDDAHDDILEGLRGLGFRSQNMDLLENRVGILKLADEESLSRIRDTDLVEALMSFQRQEILYQAALEVGARVVQTSLLDFLR